MLLAGTVRRERIPNKRREKEKKNSLMVDFERTHLLIYLFISLLLAFF